MIAAYRVVHGIPAASNANFDSLLLNSKDARAAGGIRFISLRLFDEFGNRAEQRTTSYDLEGNEVAELHRMPDGTIIENPRI